MLTSENCYFLKNVPKSKQIITQFVLIKKTVHIYDIETKTQEFYTNTTPKLIKACLCGYTGEYLAYSETHSV